MTKSHSCCLGGLAAAALLVVPALAQGGSLDPGAQLAPQRTPIHTASADEGLAYGTWAAGGSYKVSFHDGMSFVPYLGRDYPSNQSFAWTTAAVTAGEVQLLRPGREPETAQEDYRYEYRFGAVTEIYDVRTEGLEQSFRITSLPAAGDLVIRGRVASRLIAPSTDAVHGPLTFVDEKGRPIVEYGEAIAFDATGQRVDVLTAHSNGVVELIVPGEWLAAATLPVVVDPLLTRVQVATGAEVDAMDIAVEEVSRADRVLFAYVRFASAGDGDLFVRLARTNYTSQTVYSDISSAWSTDDVACAFVGGVDRWTIVMRRLFLTLPLVTSRVRCHVRPAGDLTFATNYGDLFTPAGLYEWRPDIGGVVSTATGNVALVVFQSEDVGPFSFTNTATSAVHGAFLDPTSTNGTFGASFPIRSSPAHDFERPAINSAAAGQADRGWVVAMQEYENGVANDDWDLLAVRVDDSGVVHGATPFRSDVGALNYRHQQEPQVAGARGRYAVLFSTTSLPNAPPKPTRATGMEVQVERFDWAPGASAPTADYPAVVIRSNGAPIWEVTGLGFDFDTRSHWVMAFRTITTGSSAAYYGRIGYRGELTEGGNNSAATVYFAPGQDASPIGCAYDTRSQSFRLAYGVNGAPNNPVYGQTLEYVTPAAPTTAGPACGSATIQWLGSQQIGSEFGRIAVDHPSGPVGHFLAVSLAPANLPIIDPAVLPGCRLLVDVTGPGYLGTMPFVYGSSATWPLALPEWLPPMAFHFQDWYFDGSFFAASERLRVEVVK
ncbi:MAG: hypothetical protein NXI31_23455 [bacterium]|nr:hypothetical protein [bacterium]